MSVGDFIYIVSNLVDYYVKYRFTNIFFSKYAVNKNKEILFLLILYFISTLANILFRLPILNLLISIIGLFLVTKIYRESIVKRALTVLLIYIVIVTIDLSIGLIAGKYVSNDLYLVIASPIYVLIFFIIELVVENLITFTKGKDIAVKQGLILLIIPIISIISVISMLYSEITDLKIVIIQNVTFLVINIVTFILYDWIIVAFSQKYEKDLLERQVESYTNQVEVMRQSQERVNSLKHDMKHHILTINYMAKGNRIDDILKYINTMGKEMDNPDEYVNSGNTSIDTIVNYMISKAKKLTNNIEVDIKVPSNISLDRFNINIILGNLLQNSLRALEGVENGELRIFIEYDKCIMYINIENSYSGNLKMTGDKYISTKKDSELHGIGLENVKKIVEKYSGEINISNLDNIFKVNIMMYV